MVVDNNEKKNLLDPHTFDGNYTITTFCLWVLYAYGMKDYFFNHDWIFKCWPQHVLLSLQTHPMYRDISQKILHHIQIIISYLMWGVYTEYSVKTHKIINMQSSDLWFHLNWFVF